MTNNNKKIIYSTIEWITESSSQLFRPRMRTRTWCHKSKVRIVWGQELDATRAR